MPFDAQSEMDEQPLPTLTPFSMATRDDPYVVAFVHMR